MRIPPKSAVFLALFLVPLSACRAAAPEAHAAPAEPAAPAHAHEPAAPAKVATPSAPAKALPGYTLVFLKTGPESGKLAADDNKRAFEGHFANMARMAEARQLLVAGPFGQGRHDTALRGIFVFASAQRDEAQSWGETDPPTRAGVFVQEYHALATDAPIAAALERDLSERARLTAEGKTPSPGEGVRPYVWLTAEHGDLAEREFGPLRTQEGGVFLLARLDGTRAFVLLDAKDMAEAHERFAPQLAQIGAYVLDEWFASAQLAQMVP